jgi:predicted ferric reductase
MAIAATSPLLAWRNGIYIAAAFAGIFALALLLLQPLLIRGFLPGFSGPSGRYAHRWVGSALVLAVVIHVAGLWLTSAPDVIDALTFQSPTPFSAWGVIAMWALFISALIAAFRRRLRFGLKTWRLVHTALAIIIVIGSVVHIILIEGTMGPLSKAMLCFMVVAATIKALVDLDVGT